MIIKPTKVLENENQLLDMMGLLLNLKKKARDNYSDFSEEDIEWALEQSIIRLSIRDGHDYGIPS